MNVHAESSGTVAAPATALSNCDREPIHIPGAIQPHGALIAALADSLLVTHASANLATILGRPVDAVLGRSLEDAIGKPACHDLLAVARSGAGATGHVHSLIGPDGAMLNLRAHLSGRHVCVDIKPQRIEPVNGRPISMASAMVATFRQAGSLVELCELAVNGLKAMSGYDRVMAYRFAEDGHGEVIAEAREASLAPYLGNHYPASDIPAQARRLYLRLRVGAIADSSYVPVPLLADPTLDDGTPLDLTYSALRSASPIHCEYMRNMQTAASLTIGLAYGPDLWGMLVCHHQTPRVAGFELLAAADLVGQVLSLLLVSTSEAELLAQRIQRDADLRAFATCLAAPVPLPEAFAAAQMELLRMVGAAGAVVRLSGTLVSLGSTPSTAATELALVALQSMSGGELVAVDDLAVRHPELACCKDEGSGALLLPLTPDNDDLIVWLRPERTHTITWGGNPSKPETPDPVTGRISPRTSFAAWIESVSGHSAAWTKADLAQAREVRKAVKAEVDKRTEAVLLESRAQLALLVEHSTDVIILVGLDGIQYYVSPPVELLLGWQPQDLVGRPAMVGNSSEDFVHPEDQQAFLDAKGALQTGRAAENSVCFRHRCRDGSWRWVDGRARLRMRADGTGPKDIVVTVRDATDRKTVEFKLRDALEQMERMAATDGLTGLANRRHFDGVADREWRRCARERQPLSLLLLDVDHFKLFNDRYGHPAGDGCLRAIASELASAAQRPGDLAARYGGEEFLMLMPNTERAGAAHVAERVRNRVQGLGIAHVYNSVEGVVTVSIGVATAWPATREGGPENVSALLDAADSALYRAKNDGRNRVAIAGN